MDATLLGVVLDASVPIAAERRKLTPAQAVESVQRNVGEVPPSFCVRSPSRRSVTASIVPARRIYANGGAASSMN